MYFVTHRITTNTVEPPQTGCSDASFFPVISSLTNFPFLTGLLITGTINPNSPANAGLTCIVCLNSATSEILRKEYFIFLHITMYFMIHVLHMYVYSLYFTLGSLVRAYCSNESTIPNFELY